MRSCVRLLAFVAIVLVAGVQSVFASCQGTVYFKAPKEWTDVYISTYFGKSTLMQRENSGWFRADLELLAQESFSDAFAIGQGIESSPVVYIDALDWISSSYDSGLLQHEKSFGCPGEGLSVFIYENPVSPGTTVVSSTPPNAKYLYVMIPPDFEEWNSSVPMISMDGGKTGKPLTLDPDRCGWFYYVWFGEEVSDSVVLFRSDDEGRSDMLGLYGNAEDVATMIPLNMFFESYGVDSLFFVPDVDQFLDVNDDGWYMEYPEGVEGTCTYSLAAIIYDTDASLHPSFSCYAQGAGILADGCQNGAQNSDITVALSAIYNCIGVTPGLVEPFLDPTVPQSKRKPKMSKEGAKCFINEKFFNQLFNYTEGVNEKSCYDMPFHRAADGKWEFDSDYYTSPGTKVPGGFYPVELSTDASILAADPSQKPVAAARTKRTAEGPVYYGPALRKLHPVEEVPMIDVLCNGPGWDSGFDCSGTFADGDEAAEFITSAYKLGPYDMVFGWGGELQYAPKDWPTDSRWQSAVSKTGEGGRNQHFCFESHAKFTYKPGLRFSFRGDDDIWVYIDNKLAVDLGGTHLAAPGYANLDSFEGFSGKLVVGNRYDIDIFFCDRRTTMSNVRIKTNMYITQKSDIITQKVKDGDNVNYRMCYVKSSDGSCAAAMAGDEGDVYICDDELDEVLDIKYYLSRGTILADNATLLEKGKVNKGGIDLTNPSKPVIKAEDLTLSSGRWSLFVVIDGKSKKITTFRIIGDDDEENPDSSSSVNEDDESGDVSSSSSKDSTDSKDPSNSDTDENSKKSSSSGAKDPVSSSSNKDTYEDEDGNKVEYADPSFRVKMVGAFQFAIVFDTKPSKTSKYAVMDQMGRIVKTGSTNSSETRVDVERAGQYIVKVGRRHQQVEFH